MPSCGDDALMLNDVIADTRCRLRVLARRYFALLPLRATPPYAVALPLRRRLCARLLFHAMPLSYHVAATMLRMTRLIFIDMLLFYALY